MQQCMLLYFTVILLLPASLFAIDIELCQFTGNDKDCFMSTVDVNSSIKFPSSICVFGSCADCIVTWESKALTSSGNLISPLLFSLAESRDDNGSNIAYECMKEGQPCSCKTTKCNGSLIFCQEVECNQASSCTCERIRTQTTMVLHHGEEVILNPLLISYQICSFALTPELYGEPDFVDIAKKRRRHLLSDEQAVFSEKAVTVKFSDPIFTLSDKGTLILRKAGVEHIFTIEQSTMQVVTPEIFLINPGLLKFIFVTTTGETVMGTFKIEGRDICRKLTCIFCLDVWYQLDCLPPVVQYVIYALLVFITCCTLLYIKSVLFALWTILYGIFVVFQKAIKLLKALKRYSMISGIVAGDVMRTTVANVGQNLENRVRNLANDIANPNLPLLAILFVIPLALSDCSNHQIIAANVRNCRTTLTGSICQMESKIQVSLSNLDFVQCIWFVNKNDQNLFKLQLTFKDVECYYPTTKLYYTFPTELHTINMVVCSQGEECGWGSHCHRGKTFSALTKESLSYPGINDCLGVAPATVRCAIITSEACFFHREYLKGHWARTYSVKRIDSMRCQNIIKIEESSNGTVEEIRASNTATTKQGIHIEVLGTYQQPVEIMPYKLIQRLGNPYEAYLDTAAEINRPKAGEIGDVQSNESFTNSFIFDENMFKCSIYEEQVHCHKPESYLLRMVESKINHLPKTLSFHRLFISPDGVLRSHMLHSEALVLQLTFRDYEFYIETQDVCPKFSGKILAPKGCYECDLLASIEFEAYSTCLPGTISVHFEEIQIATRALYLTDQPKTYTIQFKAEAKCYKEKLCLKGKTISACELINFCLTDPLLEIYSPNFTSAQSRYITAVATAGWDSFFSSIWPTSLFGFLKYPLILLGIILAVFFLFSMIMSICRR